MSEIKIRHTDTAGDYTTETVLEASGETTISENLIKALFGKKSEVQHPEKEVELASVPSSNPEIKHDVVAIYDNEGIPSIMHRFTKVSNKELFGGSEKTHAAFIIGGEEYDEIYISVFENCNINGKPYSLPYQKPWTGITNDNAARACFNKGEGWHLLTAPEWGLLADLCLKNDTLPHGNTNGGKYHADAAEHGTNYDGGGKTLTGSGPATWTHDHTPEGVHDLCGNIWEMVRGLRLKDGRLQAAKDNDAALDIDLTREGDGWKPVTDNNGTPIRVSVDGDSIIITTDTEIKQDYTGCDWQEVTIDCESEQLKELALFAGEPEAYCYMDSTDGEYFPIRGGYWSDGANAGVFSANLSNPRSSVDTSFGFRSAYFKKH